MKPRIVYIEDKSESLNGSAWIGRVSFSKSGRTLIYKDLRFAKVRYGYKYNHIEVESGREFWISGCKKNGGDRLYNNRPVPIDEDVRDEYWTEIRGMPRRKLDAFS